MKSPPMWKVKRELVRFIRQLFREWPRSLGSFLFGSRYYDLRLARHKKVTTGHVAATRKVAIYLIFPGQGVLASHKHALKYLIHKGYAPVVVSNLPLGPDEREDLRTLSWQIIERPNFGYDFGGYRDGVLQVAPLLSGLDRLVLLNDSTWFPVPDCNDWLDEVEELGVDFAGAASNYGIARPEHDQFRDIRWTYSRGHKNYHYCSFALAISPSILNSAKFLRFWKTFPLTNTKTRTVRRGEIGLTKWVLSNGYSHGSTLDIDHLDEDLSALPESKLHETAVQLVIPEDPKLQSIKTSVLTSPDIGSRETLEKLILTTVARQGVSYATPGYNIREKHFPFLKKSPVWLNEDASNIVLDVADRIEGDFGEVIRDEILQLRASKAPAFRRPKLDES